MPEYKTGYFVSNEVPEVDAIRSVGQAQTAANASETNGATAIPVIENERVQSEGAKANTSESKGRTVYQSESMFGEFAGNRKNTFVQ